MEMNDANISQLKAELDALRLEKELLARQVKRLVKAEGELYAYQEQLDAQLREYQGLYELNRKLAATHDLTEVFALASSYVIDNLAYEKVVFFRQAEPGGDYTVCALDGYYDDSERQAVAQLSISADDPLLAPLLKGQECLICDESCDHRQMLELRPRMYLKEYLLYLLGPQARPLAILAIGNSAERATFYRRVSTKPEALLGIGNLAGLLASAVTNQILYEGMERALEQEQIAEAKYRSMFENALHGIYRTTLDGRFMSCNPAVAEILGYDSPEDLMSSVCDIGSQIYVNPRRRDELFEMTGKGQEVKNFEAEFYRKDGSRRWVRLSARPVFDSDSQLLYIDGIFQDITEQKQTEETLIKLSQAVEQSPVTIVITDTKGVIEFVNPKFVQLTGYSREEVIGKDPGILKSGATSPEAYRRLWETISSGNVWAGEFVNKKKNGETFSERATISPIRNKDGVITHYLAIKEDISDRKLLEAQLLQSQKMESVGRLAGGVAHDFNNMLSVIIGCAQLAMLRVPEGDKVWQYLNQISKAAARSSDITRQLLAFSRKEVISVKRVNLNAKVIETQATLGRLIGEDIDLSFKPATNIWTIEADPSQLDQILVNLAVNARDAMPGGGFLSIETANVRIDPTYCQYQLDARPGDYVQLIVSDSGSGMDSETLAHIFEPFFTTKEVGKGTGLGLATVYGIVRQNNGFVTVYSEPGQGTSFKIHFPRLAAAADVEEEAGAPVVTGSGTVLLVEDDPLVREMALQMLDEIGYQVILADSPQHAIEICRRDDLQLDLILTDVVMPGMNGKAMVETIESFRPNLKVLFMSGYTSDLVAQRGVVDEGTYFIQKPFDIYSLNEKIQDTLSGDRKSGNHRK
jgi:two-component system, cell cycle sensor histidine kinase and response regulator CckA